MRNLLFIFLSFMFLSCHLFDDKADDVTLDDIRDVAEMNQSFSWDIFHEEIKSDPAKNVLISPLSIQTALSMAANGAGGLTLTELMEVLYCANCDLMSMNAQQQKLFLSLIKQSGHPEITVSNAYFYDPNRIMITDPFVNTLSEYYDCTFRKDDFDNEEKALENINNWVSSSTNGKIEEILDKIGPLDVAFLINALYFKSDWAKGFAKELSHEGNFTLEDGSNTRVMFVSGDRNIPYAVTGEWEIADIPFRDSTYSLSLIQAKGGKSISDLGRTEYKELLGKINYERLYLAFPRLKLSYENDLIASLKSLGMISAFDGGKADFKAMGTSSNNVYISQIKHKAVLEVDEKGAEGAAVTSIGFSNTSMPMSMTFNKPFVLVLRHIESNTILFMGYIRNPAL